MNSFFNGPTDESTVETASVTVAAAPEIASYKCYKSALGNISTFRW